MSAATTEPPTTELPTAKQHRTVLASDPSALSPGSKVSVLWSPGNWFLGTLSDVEKETFTVEYDDGDSKTHPLSLLSQRRVRLHGNDTGGCKRLGCLFAFGHDGACSHELDAASQCRHRRPRFR